MNLMEGLEQRQHLSASVKVLGNAVTIAAGDRTPSRADYTDFGPMEVSGSLNNATRTFTIRNTGTSTMNLTGKRVAIVSGDNDQFSIVKRPAATIAPGGRSTFTVSFNPLSAGWKGANIQVRSDAANKSEYNLKLTGKGEATTLLTGGLAFSTTKNGTGNGATTGNSITMQYTGFRLDGKVFDDGTFPFTLGIGQVIAGWDEGLAGVKVGEKRTLYIPAAKAYGASGAGADIPPNTPLIFEVERTA
jgi:hypothetical protein